MKHLNIVSHPEIHATPRCSVGGGEVHLVFSVPSGLIPSQTRLGNAYKELWGERGGKRGKSLEAAAPSVSRNQEPLLQRVPT